MTLTLEQQQRFLLPLKAVLLPPLDDSEQPIQVLRSTKNATGFIRIENGMPTDPDSVHHHGLHSIGTESIDIGRWSVTFILAVTAPAFGSIDAVTGMLTSGLPQQLI